MKWTSDFIHSLKYTVIGFFLYTAAISAHPHLFIDVMVKFMLNDSTLSGVNVFWDLDEMTSASLINEFDLNHNNHFEKTEYKKLENDAFSHAAQFNFFTVCTWGKNVLQINTINKFVATIQPDLKIRYSFFIPCNFSLSEIVGQDIIFFFNDPSMFAAFELKKKLIQVSTNKFWYGTITFKKENFNELIVLTIKENKQ